MAFLIPDNLKSRSDASATIRRIASAFQAGLDDAATVWFEPPFDPSGEKPHLVVLLPDRGIVVLEALEHQAGNVLGVVRKRIRVTPETCDEAPAEVEVRSPLDRAETFAEVLKQRIAAEPRLAGLSIAVGYGAVLANLTEEDVRTKRIDRVVPPSACIFRPDLEAAICGEGEAGLNRAFARILGRAAQQLPARSCDLLRGIIHPDVVIAAMGDSPEAPKQGVLFRSCQESDVVGVMDRQQEAMAKSLGTGHRVIRGVAGSGKTLVLVYRARLLAQLLPAGRVLVTCFTRSLAGQLRAMLADSPNIEVAHLDRHMAQVIRDAGLEHPGFRGADAGEKVAAVALQALAKGAGMRYDAVLVDEAQDFGTTALRVAVGLLEDGSDDLLVVADSAQNIFRRQFSWKQAGIQAQGRTRILRRNYRNTEEVLRFAREFLLGDAALYEDAAPDVDDMNALIPPESASRNGASPLVQLVPDIGKEIATTIAQIKAWLKVSSSPRSIAILYADSREQRAIGIAECLRAEKIASFWLTDPKDKGAKDRLPAADAPVILSTIHSAKGLEFPYVIMCGLPKDDESGGRMLAYVGMTRSTDHLAIVVQDRHPLAGELMRAFEETAIRPPLSRGRTAA